MYFAKKVFLVTGATEGIGRAIVKLLLKNQAIVIAVSRNQDKLDRLEHEMGMSELKTLRGDVSQEINCKRMIEVVIENHERLDGLIQVVGVSMRGKAVETKIEVIKKLMEVNFFSMVYLFKYAYPYLEKTKGHLVGISSMQGQFALPFRSGYVASKHALQGFIDSVRLELKDSGIHVMICSPGYVKTNHSFNALNGDGTPYRKMDSGQKSGLDPSIVAKAVIQGIYKRKRAVFPSGFQEKFALLLSKCSPSLLDKILLLREK